LLEDLETPLRFANGLFTVLLAILLYNIYWKKAKRFYLLWSLGYLFYGLNLFVRIFVVPPGMYPLVFLVVGFAMILTGLGDLINRTRDMALVSILLPVVMILLMLTPNPTLIVWLISILPYLLTAISLLFIKRSGVVDVDMLIIGWFILLLTNLALAYELMIPPFVEIMAIFGKLVIYCGMVKPQFSLMAEDLKQFLISGNPTSYATDDATNKFILLSAPTNQKRSETEWIAARIEENAARAIRTIIVSVYGIITIADLHGKKINEENVYIVHMVTGGHTNINVFEERILSINDDVNLLDILFTDIIKYSGEKKIKCEIIIYSLSHLIHTHGSKRVYSFLISKIPVIKSGIVSLVGVYYPETHEKTSETSIFESLANQVVEV
jgi:hypothetical protein